MPEKLSKPNQDEYLEIAKWTPFLQNTGYCFVENKYLAQMKDVHNYLLENVYEISITYVVTDVTQRLSWYLVWG